MTPGQLRGARRLWDSRKLRNAMFGTYSDGFGEPGWDMMLCLAIDSERRIAMPITELIARAGVSDEIGRIFVRWFRSQDLAINDESVVQLTPRAHDLLGSYLDRTGELNDVL